MQTTYAQKNETIQKASANTAESVVDSSSQSATLQRHASLANAAVQRAENPPRPNNTGLPDDLKNGVESLSGYSLDNVRVHYNSPKPATVQALAFTQGTDIHVAAGQEHALPHEAWHVAQQMAGRVTPTTNIGGMPVNDNAALEHEADVMGEKAVTQRMVEGSASTLKSVNLNGGSVQRILVKSFGSKSYTCYVPERMLGIARIEDVIRKGVKSLYNYVNVTSFCGSNERGLTLKEARQANDLSKLYFKKDSCYPEENLVPYRGIQDEHSKQENWNEKYDFTTACAIQSLYNLTNQSERQGQGENDLKDLHDELYRDKIKYENESEIFAVYNTYGYKLQGSYDKTLKNFKEDPAIQGGRYILSTWMNATRSSGETGHMIAVVKQGRNSSVYDYQNVWNDNDNIMVGYYYYKKDVNGLPLKSSQSPGSSKSGPSRGSQSSGKRKGGR